MFYRDPKNSVINNTMASLEKAYQRQRQRPAGSSDFFKNMLTGREFIPIVTAFVKTITRKSEQTAEKISVTLQKDARRHPWGFLVAAGFVSLAGGILLARTRKTAKAGMREKK